MKRVGSNPTHAYLIEMNIRLTYSSYGGLPRERERLARSFLYALPSSNGQDAALSLR